MSVRSAVAGSATAATLVAVLGSQAASDVASDAESTELAATLTAFPAWDVGDLPGEVVGEVALRLTLLVMLTGLVCALAGRSRSRAAAGVAGWGALVVGAGLAAAAAHAYEMAVVVEGPTDTAEYVDGLTRAVNAGAAFGAWTGWLVGLIVALAIRPARAAAPVAAAGARPAGAGAGAGAAADVGPAGRIAEPPPPWWAPTQAGSGDAAVRPGPSAFPPGGMAAAHPVVPAPQSIGHARPVVTDATYEMTTVSGDPHPSDPDATRPVGLPDGQQAGPGGGEPQRGAGKDTEADADPDPDPDATTIDTPDRTERMPRSDD